MSPGDPALRGATFVFGGGFAAFAAVLLVAGLAWSRDEATSEALEVAFVDSPPPGSATPGEPPPAPVPIASLSAPSAAPPSPRPAIGPDLSKAKTVEDLRALAGEHPRDASVLRALVQAEARAGRPPPKPSLDALAQLLQLDAKANSSADVAAVVKSATTSEATREQALQLLQGPMGEVGFDLLLELAGAAGPAKARALELTKSPAAQAHASAAAKVYVKLRDAQVCARKAHLDEASQVGDARAVSLIKPMVQQTSCGFLGLERCPVCRDGAPAAQQALKAIEARTGG